MSDQSSDFKNVLLELSRLKSDVAYLTSQVTAINGHLRDERQYNSSQDYLSSSGNVQYNYSREILNLVNVLFSAKKGSWVSRDDANLIIKTMDELVATCIGVEHGCLTQALKKELPILLGASISTEFVDQVLDSCRHIIDQKFTQINSILKDTLKLHGAISLVSEDLSVREQTQQLLKHNGIDTEELLGRYKKKD